MAGGREADYRDAGFAGEIGFGARPALVVIDLMMAYFDPASPMYAPVEKVLRACLGLIDAAATRHVPVFVTRQVYDEEHDGVYVRKVPALKLLRAGSRLGEVHPSVQERGGETIVKRFPSAFHGTALARRLHELEVDTPIVVGLTTSGCIRATAMDCLLGNFHGIVVRDAVGDRDVQAHEANLFDINNKLADVRDSEQVLAWMNRYAAA